MFTLFNIISGEKHDFGLDITRRCVAGSAALHQFVSPIKRARRWHHVWPVCVANHPGWLTQVQSTDSLYKHVEGEKLTLCSYIVDTLFSVMKLL